jgi:hypothetical protein
MLAPCGTRVYVCRKVLNVFLKMTTTTTFRVSIRELPITCLPLPSMKRATSSVSPLRKSHFAPLNVAPIRSQFHYPISSKRFLQTDTSTGHSATRQVHQALLSSSAACEQDSEGGSRLQLNSKTCTGTSRTRRKVKTNVDAGEPIFW